MRPLRRCGTRPRLMGRCRLKQEQLPLPFPEQPPTPARPRVQKPVTAEAASPAEPDLFSAPPPRTLSRPVGFPLSPVSLHQFRQTATPATVDTWLYYGVTDPSLTGRLLEDGLLPDRADPPLLREAGAALRWLADLDEELLAEGRVVLFRLRRKLVRDVMELDPDGSSEPGARGYFLMKM
ncbi:hypothetical protein GOB87_14315 [Acetobacter estunensis]|uniref:Uncharacterized protein n=2 Tax=Acetobacter estunensis TaxID=104097 RepID=A0A967EJH1_9PROT|nr:hypothetical protein [Acetobacter estunensis]